MFPLPPSQDDELKASHFTALSLSTGIQGAQQSHIPSQVANKVQSSSFPYTINGASPMKVKRKRCLDGAALTIGTGSSSNPLKMKVVDHPTGRMSCASFGGDYIRKQRPAIATVSGFCNTPCQLVQGVSNENANKNSANARAGRGSASYVNDPNRACLYQQSASGLSCENNSKRDAHSRASKTSGNTSISDKIHQRMIKNRESAARSRARKQALEAQQQLENTELKKENDFLKRVVRFLLAILRTKRMKLPPLSRSFSGPL
ncbi:unnamed protein product [Dovyalis caffra]|uniref:BZIP domain-containing protein n=1 Tax=Dovyalis caffra TaxID=77055 RepID=A0AAV1QSK4_9ROSI|nr:unnamed protein product [Dovyalis caffra]